MLTLEKRIKAFSTLGEIMLEGAAGKKSGVSSIFTSLINELEESNPWFTPDNVKLAIESIGESLSDGNLNLLMARYPQLKVPVKPGNVGIVMAGNIPLVGFHDLMSVLLTGNNAIAKVSSKDDKLMRAVTETLIKAEPGFCNCIRLTSDTLSGFDSVIATGSDNSSRYFEYYFRGYPSIIRHNRNSIAFIDGNETEEEIKDLSTDIFSYFGLGCRNVSKLYLPAGYNINKMISCWDVYEKLREHSKYAANYDHSKAIMIVNRQPFIDSGFILLRQDNSLTPPMAVLNYEFYESDDKVKTEFNNLRERIQCITGHGFTPFGLAQKPFLWDFADDVDTILFLLKNFSID